MIVIFVLSLNTNSEYFSTSLWFIPSSMMVTAIAFGNRKSKLIDTVFSNKVIQYMGNISFEFFLIHQLAINYLSIISKRIINYNGAIVYFAAFVGSVVAALIWRSLIKNIISERRLKNERNYSCWWSRNPTLSTNNGNE